MKRIVIILTILLSMANPSCAGLSDINATSVREFPQDYTIRFDYDGRTDGNPVYVGYATKASAEGTDGWIIIKFAYDGSNQVTSKKVAFGNWTARAGYTYN